MMNYYRDYEDAYERMCEERIDAMRERALEERIQDLEAWGRDAYADELMARDAFESEDIVQVLSEDEYNQQSIAQYREIFP